MHPNPSADISNPVFPKVLYSIKSPVFPDCPVDLSYDDRNFYPTFSIFNPFKTDDMRTYLIFTAMALAGTILSGMIHGCQSPPDEVFQWRGENRNGIYNEEGLKDQWPEGGPELLWVFEKH
jgi:hypothetical protein